AGSDVRYSSHCGVVISKLYSASCATRSGSHHAASRPTSVHDSATPTTTVKYAVSARVSTGVAPRTPRPMQRTRPAHGTTEDDRLHPRSLWNPQGTVNT